MRKVPVQPGTRVRFEARSSGLRKLADLFAQYTDDYAFSNTRTVVKLFAHGVRFVSRSEARRHSHGLERFDHVTLDFGGVEEIGQGFVDEVFRVWSKAHPRVKLVPVVAFAASRAVLARAAGGAAGPALRCARRSRRCARSSPLLRS